MNSHATKVETIRIEDVFSRTYVVPLYQRGYAWGKEEIWQLLNDFWDAYLRRAEVGSYYIGSLTTFLRSNSWGGRAYELIDGQQRTITLGLLLRLFEYYLSPDNRSFMRLADCLRFENRLAATAFLESFDNDPLKTSVPSGAENFQAAADAILEHEIFGEERRGQFHEFVEFVKNNVFLFLVTMPAETDVSAYFEIMNNRGVQLEFHELLKAELIARLPEEADSSRFDRLWTACSHMKGPSLDSFLDDETFNALSSRKSWMELVKDEIKNEVPDNGEERSILPDFPNFLLHVLRVYLGDATIRLDEQQMKKIFDEHIAKIDAARFLDVLIQTRIRFDRYVIKAVGVGADSDWFIEIGEEKRLDCCESLQNDWERLTYLQSMLQVSYPSRRHKEWLSRILCSEATEALGLITLLENFVREDLKNVAVDSLRQMGQGTPHRVLNLIDYLMYCEHPEKYSDQSGHFRFAYRNSVEHHFPQNFATNAPSAGWENNVNDIGNLCLLTRDENSRLNDHTTDQKVVLTQSQQSLNHLPPKRRAMYELTKEKHWCLGVMKEHSDYVMGLLHRFLD